MFYTIYFLMLLSSYKIISEEFNYEGYIYVVNYPVIILSLFLVFFLDLKQYNKKGKIEEASDFYKIIINYFVYVPLLCYSSLGGVDLLFSLVCIFGIYIVSIFSNIKTHLPIVRLRSANNIVLIISVLMVIASILSISSSGFNLDVSKVYEFRSKIVSGSYSGMWGYINSWGSKIFIFSIYIVLHSKGYKILSNITLLLLGVLFFGFTSQKSILAFCLFVILLSIVKSYGKFNFNYLHSILIMLFGFPIVIYIFYGDSFLLSLINRRVIFLPQKILFTYYDFFSKNEYVFMSNSILSTLSNYPYDLKTSNVIGNYLGKPDMGANSGFLATGYMHFGIIGVLFFSMFLGIILSVINIFVRFGLDIIYVIALSISPILSFIISSDLGTVILTHGLLLCVFILYILSLQSKNIK